MKIYDDYSLLHHNTFGIDVRCRRFVEYESVEELRHIIGQTQESAPTAIGQTRGEAPTMHIGGGSNLLFLGDYDGLVLHSAIRDLRMEDEGETVTVRAGAGLVWDELVEYTLGQGWYGLENLSLIPGEVGASAVQNIGAYGAEAKDFITEVECMDLRTAERRTFSNAECRYAYRKSLFKAPEQRGRWAVLYVTYRLSKHFTPHLDYGGIRGELARRGIATDTLTASQLRQVIVEMRRAKLPDPQVLGNAGSFFVNPVVPRPQYEALVAQYPAMPHYDVGPDEVKIPAGWLIEQCGWKGRSLGQAAVHDRQALVLVNRGRATGADIMRLCEAVRRDVRSRFGIDIHPEVNVIGSMGVGADSRVCPK